MNTISGKKISVSIIIALASLLFSYAVYKAWVLSITWDEAFSYLEYVRFKVWGFDNYGRMSANNHLLNTWSMILFDSLFGNSEFSLRIGSLIAYLFYLFFSAKISLQFKNNLFSVCAFIILNFHPYLIDFFSLARGYGMAMGFMMASVYFTFRYFEEHKLKHIWFLSAFSILSVLANFSLLNFLLVQHLLLILYILFRPLYSTENNYIHKALHIAHLSGAGFFTLAFSLPVLFQLKKAGALFWGGSRGFWEDTVAYLLESLLYQKPYAHITQSIIGILIIVTLIFSYNFCVIKWKKKQFLNPSYLKFFFTFFIGTGCALSTIIQHHYLGTNYLITRTALLFIPLFLLLILYIQEALVNKYPKCIALIFLIALSISAHGVLAMNKNYVYEWKSNADVKEVVQWLEKNHQIKPWKKSVTIGVDLDFGTPVDFYRVTNKLVWLSSPIQDGKTSILHDFYFASSETKELIKNIQIRVIKNLPTSNSFLIKNAKPYVAKQLTSIKGTMLPPLTYKEGEAYKYKFEESSKGFDSFIDVEIEYTAIKRINASFSLSFGDAIGDYYSQTCNLADTYNPDSLKQKLVFTIICPEVSENDIFRAKIIPNPNTKFAHIIRTSMNIKKLNKK